MMDERIINILNYIESNIDKPLQLESLSDIACISPFHFHRLFKRETGITLKQFIERIKIEKACQSILNGSNSILDLAAMLGYNDYETFSRAFKKHHKISPDDLKSVVINVRAQVKNDDGENKVIIVTHNNFNEVEISEKISKSLSENNIQLSGKATEKIFLVTNKNENKMQNKNTTKVKNKFNMTAEPTFWKNILKSLTTQKIILALVLLLSVGGNRVLAQVDDGGKDLTHFLKKKDYTAIKLQKYLTGHLYFEVTINGVKGRFILDSGAGATVVEEKRKDKFKMISSQTEEKATGAGGSGMEIQSSSNNKLVINSYTIDNYTAMMMNLDHVNTAFKQLGLEEIDGVIGADILTSGQAVIDYTNMTLYLK